MFEKLETVELKFVELESQMNSGSLQGAELSRIIKEHGKLEELVQTYRQYKNLKGELQAAREMMHESDSEMVLLAKEEMSRLEPLIRETEQNLQILTLPSDPNDEKNVILEIRAGTGGDEAGLFAGDLLRTGTTGRPN